MKARVAVLVALVIAAAAGGAFYLQHRPPPPPQPGTAPGTDGTFVQELEVARSLSRESNRPVFMLFTGSDWCRPCELMEKEVFSGAPWKQFAALNLVCMMCDFPKHKPQSDAQKAQNQKLQADYKIEGYPSMVIVAPDGKELGRVTTLPDAQYFIEGVQKVLHPPSPAF